MGNEINLVIRVHDIYRYTCNNPVIHVSVPGYCRLPKSSKPHDHSV